MFSENLMTLAVFKFTSYTEFSRGSSLVAMLPVIIIHF